MLARVIFVTFAASIVLLVAFGFGATFLRSKIPSVRAAAGITIYLSLASLVYGVVAVFLLMAFALFVYATFKEVPAYREIIESSLSPGLLLGLAFLSYFAGMISKALWEHRLVYREWAKRTLTWRFADRVPRGLPKGQADDPNVLAFSAVYVENFNVRKQYNIDGWSAKMYLRRLRELP